MIVKLSNLTVYVSFNEMTSLKAFVFCGFRLALLPQCEETAYDADIPRCMFDDEEFGVRDVHIIVFLLTI